jgi:type IV pilus assembly protein PilA
VKRRGFTLIELMVVIAIIIILAAIAIPNYLKMTERAKKSRLQSDMATLATCLETFKTDWGTYPVLTTAAGEGVSIPASIIYHELAGTDTAATTGHKNTGSATNAVGETNPAGGPCIEYLKAGTLTSMVNPFSAVAGDEIRYRSSTGGTQWILWVDTKIGATANIMYRTDGSSTVSYAAAYPTTP